MPYIVILFDICCIIVLYLMLIVCIHVIMVYGMYIIWYQSVLVHSFGDVSQLNSLHRESWFIDSKAGV